MADKLGEEVLKVMRRKIEVENGSEGQIEERGREGGEWE